MPTISKSLLLDTALGTVKFTVSIKGNDVSNEHIILSTFPVEPKLPSGMSVKNCNALLIQIRKAANPFSLRYTANLASSIKGTSCTGQGLAAIEWEDSQSIVVIGTEDEEALIYRMPWLKTDMFELEETYEPSLLSINIAKAMYPQKMSFHFIIAENPMPEPKEVSAWFAVDSGHSKILAHADSK